MFRYLKTRDRLIQFCQTQLTGLVTYSGEDAVESSTAAEDSTAVDDKGAGVGVVDGESEVKGEVRDGGGDGIESEREGEDYGAVPNLDDVFVTIVNVCEDEYVGAVAGEMQPDRRLGITNLRSARLLVDPAQPSCQDRPREYQFVESA